MQEISENPRRLGFWDPFEEFLRPTSVAPFAQTAAGPREPWTSAATEALRSARMDVWDRGDSYAVEVELPGVRREDISVHMDGNRLYVSAERRSERTYGGACSDSSAGRIETGNPERRQSGQEAQREAKEQQSSKGQEVSREQSERSQRGRACYCERVYGSIRRTVELPAGCDSERVRATYNDGVLCVCVPKRSTSERSRSIAVE